MNPLALLLCSLFAVTALAGEPPRAAAGQGAAPPPRKTAKQPPDARIASLQLPQVFFRDADFAGALEYFRRKAAQQSNGNLKLTFVPDVPGDFRPKHELSLDLRNVPFMVALNYFGELAGVQFTIDGTTVSARAGTAPPPKDAPLPQEAPSSVNGSRALARSAEPAAAGNNTYRKLDGTIQPDKSGYVPHRSMGGWSIKDDPYNLKSTNCSKGKPCDFPCKCCCRCADAGGEKAKPAK